MLGILLISIFLVGYAFIILEEFTGVDKAACSLLTGILSWMAILAFGDMDTHAVINELKLYVFEVHQVIFFLMGAMLIVEVIDSHKGFEIITRHLNGKPCGFLFVMIQVLAFFLSSILDNLTTIIVLICILKKLLPDAKQRMLYSASLVFTVNAGGAWTPIGDVTTTMLWVDEKITTTGVMQALLIPSLVSAITFCGLLFLKLPKAKVAEEITEEVPHEGGTKRVLLTGLSGLLLAPLLKGLLGLPPFMSVLLGVGVLWIVTDLSLPEDAEDKQHLRVYSALGRIDISSLLFFFGILLSVDALDIMGYLSGLSRLLEFYLPSQDVVSVSLGFLSALVDNVPLVSACMKIYGSLAINHATWFMVAYCAGVGGSLLVIGSAPGIALVSLEGVSFKWYLKEVFPAALLAYLVGVASLLLLA